MASSYIVLVVITAITERSEMFNNGTSYTHGVALCNVYCSWLVLNWVVILQIMYIHYYCIIYCTGGCMDVYLP